MRTEIDLNECEQFLKSRNLTLFQVIAPTISIPSHLISHRSRFALRKCSYFFDIDQSIDLRLVWIDLNECEHFGPKRTEIDLSVNGHYKRISCIISFTVFVCIYNNYRLLRAYIFTPTHFGWKESLTQYIRYGQAMLIKELLRATPRLSGGNLKMRRELTGVNRSGVNRTYSNVRYHLFQCKISSIPI